MTKLRFIWILSHIIDEEFVFISHAHTDHLLNKKHLRKFNLKNKVN